MNPVKNNMWYRNVLSTLNINEFDKAALEMFDRGDKVTEEEIKNVENKAREISPLKEKKEESKGLIDYLKKFREHNNSNEDILYKDNKLIPQSEINRASKYVWFDSRDKIVKTRLSNKITSWYSQNFGDEPAQKDASGQFIRPKARIEQATKEIRLQTRDGMDIDDGYRQVADYLEKRDRIERVAKGSFTLQRALNQFSYDPQLIEDGSIGEKTVSRLKQTLAEHGVNALLKKIG